MSATANDPERIPVVVASGQSIERTELVTPVDLMERACLAAFAHVPALRGRVDRLSVVDVMTHTGPSPASELAGRIGAGAATCEVTSIGGNSPQWLVNRAATDIARGAISVSVIAGAEAIRSSRNRRAAGLPREPGVTTLPPDPVVGDDRPGVGPGEAAIGLLAPVHIYPMFESVVAARAGHDAFQHRSAMGELFAPFTTVAAANPFAWFPEARSAESIATASPDNRIVCEPYTKRMTAFLGSDQGAALIVCSLAAAARAGAADRAVFIWSGAEAVDVRFPTARPDPGRSPAMAAAGRALFEAASTAAGGGRRIGVDEIDVLDLYSCFPSAVELATDALGIATDDRRGLTVTGGLPYFGGPGNNYTTHGIATVTDILRDPSAGVDGGRSGAGASPVRMGLATGLGWFITKHAMGLYATAPPPGGFRPGDTTAAQSEIDASAVEVALEVDTPIEAVVVAATVIRDYQGNATGAPLIVRVPDNRQMAVAAADDDVVAAVGHLDVPGLVGSPVVVEAGAPRYRLATG
jgi:acetyl-CoA C-acetyltransferase